MIASLLCVAVAVMQHCVLAVTVLMLQHGVLSFESRACHLHCVCLQTLFALVKQSYLVLAALNTCVLVPAER